MKLYGTSSITVVTESISVNSIPNAGGIFLSASSIYMKNYDNEVYDLTDTNGFMRVTVYTSSGVYNYSRPGNIAYLQIICIGGGGGGGAGARNTTGNNRGGGGGGGAGVIAQRWFPSGSIPPGIYTVTVGASGSGGVTGSIVGTSAAGNNGSSGGASSFTSTLPAVTYLSANGGNAGIGCTVAGVAAGANEQTTAIVSGSGLATTIYRLVGMTGGTGGVLAQSTKTPNSITSTPNPIHPTADSLLFPIYAFAGNKFGISSSYQSGYLPPDVRYQGGCWYGIGGGGGGGHISSLNVTVNGGTGASAYIWNTLTPAGTSGTVGQNGGDGTNNIVDGNFLIAASSSYFPTASIGPGSPGGGGGPGDTVGAINGGRGGNAGNYGAGGGGGGGSTDPAQAGNGGSGGTGCVIIFEYF
jgi:hypothetical protein